MQLTEVTVVIQSATPEGVKEALVAAAVQAHMITCCESTQLDRRGAWTAAITTRTL